MPVCVDYIPLLVVLPSRYPTAQTNRIKPAEICFHLSLDPDEIIVDEQSIQCNPRRVVSLYRIVMPTFRISREKDAFSSRRW